MKLNNLMCVVLLLVVSACKKDDNEPMPKSTVSRLYVSNADTDAAVANTMIFDPADQSPFLTPYVFDSKLPDANGIVFDPFSGIVFQVSRQSQNIRSMKVKTDGTLEPGTSFLDESLASAREIAFDRIRNILYVASSSDSSIYVYEQAKTLTGTITANKKLKLNGEPWGIHLDDNRLFVVIDHGGEVQLFESASSLTVGVVNPYKTISIQGAKRLNGITYSPVRDALILTDVGEYSATGYDSDGTVYIIEEASDQFKEEPAVVSPTRTIGGQETSLGNPMDVSIDDREGKDYIYVAEKANRRILVFKYSDNGNIPPSITTVLTTSPQAIYLDAR